MATIIDRRLNSRGKTHGSRQRFIRRLKGQAEVKKAVQDAVRNTNIKDFGKDKVSVPVKGVDEPSFRTDPRTGKRRTVVTGNKDWVEGDTFPRPSGGGGPGSGPGAGDVEGMDEFSFDLTKEEFMDVFMSDFELPDLVERGMKEVESLSLHRTGYKASGNPAQLSVSQMARRALGRRIALHRPSEEDLEKARGEIAQAEAENASEKVLSELREWLETLERRTRAIPYFDPVDLRYRAFTPRPDPRTQAVMFCLMDVSGSMGEREKGIGKRFFILLYLLLTKTYQDIEIVFVRHHSRADEVDEHTFFYDQVAGGTVVSSGFNKLNEIIDKRYSPKDWNIYVSQVSDGDNSQWDHSRCMEELGKLLPRVQYHAYLEVPLIEGKPTDLYKTIEVAAKEYGNVGMAQAKDASGIWAALSKLFGRAKGEENV